MSPVVEGLFVLMARWAPDVAVRRRIFVDNPATLYDFAAV
jgi:predicted TIM-barrel fold metal-dependent hydrolase